MRNISSLTRRSLSVRPDKRNYTQVVQKKISFLICLVAGLTKVMASISDQLLCLDR